MRVKAIVLTALVMACASKGAQAIEGIASLGDKGWLVAEAPGLVIRQAKEKTTVVKKGRYAQPDAIAVGPNEHLVAAVDISDNRLVLWRAKTGEFKQAMAVDFPHSELNGLCLYLDRAQRLVYAFVITSDQPVEQRLIYDLKRDLALDQSVRQLPAGGELKSCSVDQRSGQVYLAEEKVGVWSLGASPEAGPERRPVAMLAPFGELHSEISGISATQNGLLLISQPEKNTLLAVDPNGALNKDFMLNEVEFVASDLTADGLEIAFANELGDFSVKTLSHPSGAGTGEESFPLVMATVETTPVQRFGDAADDPAIWVNLNDPQQSRILATDKKAGLAVYNLQGELTQFLPTGRLNNVDLRQGVALGQRSGDIAVASHRDSNSISTYFIQPTGELSHQAEIATGLDEVYGICSYLSSKSDEMYVFINDKDGRYEQYQLIVNGGQLNGKLVRTFKMQDQPEGCVADDESGRLYVGVEDHGVWVTSAEAGDKAQMVLIDKIGEHLTDDVEGIALYKSPEHHYLVVSSQGNNTYTLYQAHPPYAYVGRFRIGANSQLGIDGASETDGLDVSSANLGGAFSQGVLVVQDGHNVMPQQPQNFKLVPFSQVLENAVIPLP